MQPGRARTSGLRVPLLPLARWVGWVAPVRPIDGVLVLSCPSATLRVCSVLGRWAPVHRCARAVCCGASAVYTLHHRVCHGDDQLWRLSTSPWVSSAHSSQNSFSTPKRYYLRQQPALNNLKKHIRTYNICDKIPRDSWCSLHHCHQTPTYAFDLQSKSLPTIKPAFALHFSV